MKALHERIRGKIASKCAYSVSITDCINNRCDNSVNYLKRDKYNDDGILMSHNFLQDTH